MGAEPFYEMYKSISPISQVSLRRICLRREFQKALVFKTRTDFPSMKDLRTVFDAADKDKIGYLTTDGVRGLLQSFDNSLSEDEIRDIVDSIDLDESGKISFEKFRTMFSLDD
jgi:Ca2+-binding EF-hand superfamily protein